MKKQIVRLVVLSLTASVSWLWGFLNGAEDAARKTPPPELRKRMWWDL